MSNELIRTMFKHLVKTYSVDEAREILVTKYPNAEEFIAELDATEEVQEVTNEPTPEKVEKAVRSKATPKKVKKEKGPSKIDRARELYEAAEDKSRKAIIDLFVKELEMSKAAASTYYYNCKK